jgi:DNA-binding NtrC family response regulator
MPRTIVILDSPAGQLRPLARAFARAVREDAALAVVTSAEALEARLRAGLACDLVVVDVGVGDGVRPGPAVLAQLRRDHPLLPLVAVAEHGDVAAAAQAVRAGATDFLVRGGRLAQRVATLLGKVRTLLDLRDENRLLGEQNRLLLESHRARYRIVGESAQILEVGRAIERVARIPRPVLIIGERGTGKELVARAIHDLAAPGSRPFVAVNCAAFTESLLDSELFGHERGAFTGADSVAHGRFEQARGGTLFLDEIGNMSAPFQQKLLRVIEYGTFVRVGGSREISAAVRVISATNADLEERMRRGSFARDLYDRLSFEVIRVPPLREREGDVEVLARHFLDEFMREIPALGGKRLGAAAIKSLRAYAFPGNVRELKNIIERAAYREVASEITAEDLGPLTGAAGTPRVPGRTFVAKLDAFRRQVLRDALATAGGNQAAAARALGLAYHRFRYYYQRYAAR